MTKVACSWVFRIEIVSDKTPYTKDIKKKLEELFFSQDLFGNWKIDELYEDAEIASEKKPILKTKKKEA